MFKTFIYTKIKEYIKFTKSSQNNFEKSIDLKLTPSDIYDLYKSKLK